MLMKLPRITKEKDKRLSLRQRTQQAIKHAIITCDLEPGEPIREADLAERFGVSKTPVREALTSLMQSNFVDYTTNRGFTVSTISISDVQEIYEARTFYETGLFRLALCNLSDADINKLVELNEITFDLEEPESIDDYMQANTDFHLCIAKASRNSRLVQQYQIILDEAQRLMYLDLIHNNVLLTWHSNHERIIAAIRNQDEQAGVDAIREIITNQKLRNFGPG